ncbi:hypothetical protein B0H14DRAFT_2605749 [Mycena olivaceomarginata]|nr:hypothetical protein B0H14DRAFT_2605749 [Mycena olivaceomarginata]
MSGVEKRDVFSWMTHRAQLRPGAGDGSWDTAAEEGKMGFYLTCATYTLPQSKTVCGSHTRLMPMSMSKRRGTSEDLETIGREDAGRIKGRSIENEACGAFEMRMREDRRICRAAAKIISALPFFLTLAAYAGIPSYFCSAAHEITWNRAVTASPLFSSLGHLVAGISLSVPTADVVQSTSVDCQWTAYATDPAAFALVVQFSNASSLFGELAAVTTVQRGTNTSGTVPNIKNVAVSGMHRLAAYADPFDPNSQPFALSPAFNVVVPTIVLSVPTTDVTVGTSVNCQWTSGATHPATFSLVMQFSNSGSPQFGDLALVTVVRRGTTASGTVPNIKNVAVLGSSATGVVGTPTCVGCGRIELCLKPVFYVHFANEGVNKHIQFDRNNHNTIIIAVVVICVVLALAILGLLLLLLRRRRRKNAGMSDITRPRSLLTEDLGPSGAATLNAPPSDYARFSTGPVSHQHERRYKMDTWSPSDIYRPDESNPPLSVAGSGSTLAVPESNSDRAVSQRLQRTELEAELEALRAEVRALTQPPPSYFPEYGLKNWTILYPLTPIFVLLSFYKKLMLARPAS